MKRILSLLLACSMLLAVTACGDDSSTKAADTGESVSDSAKPEDSAKETEAAATTTEATAATTTAETTKEAEQDSKSEDSQSEDSAASDKNAGELLSALINRMKDWKGQTVLNMKAESDGMAIVMEMVMAGKKFYYNMDMAGMFKLTGLSDGTTTYMLDPDTKTFAKNADKDQLGMETPDNMVDDMMDGRYVSTGTAKFHGKDYTYEEYKPKEGSDNTENARYFFDDNGDIIGLTSKDENGETQEIDFTIKLEETIDESRFQMPSGYTEKDSKKFMEELATKMLSAIFSAMGDMTDTASGQ